MIHRIKLGYIILLFIIACMIYIMAGCFASDYTDLEAILTPTPDINIPTPTPDVDDLIDVCSYYTPGTTFRMILQDIKTAPSGLGSTLNLLFENYPIAITILSCDSTEHQLSAELVITKHDAENPASGLNRLCPLISPDSEITLYQPSWAIELYGKDTGWYETDPFNLEFPLDVIMEDILGIEIESSIIIPVNNIIISGSLSSSLNILNSTFTTTCEIESTIDQLKSYMGKVYCGIENSVSGCTADPGNEYCTVSGIEDYSYLPGESECDISLFSGTPIRLLIDILLSMESYSIDAVAWESDGINISESTDSVPADNEFSSNIFEDCY